MKISVRLLVLALFLFTACKAAVFPPTIPITPGQTDTPFSPGVTDVAGSPDPTAPPALTVTPTPGAPEATATSKPAGPLRSPTPTAWPLPTRSSRIETEPPGRSRPTQPSLLDQYLPEREEVAETEHFIFYAQDGYFPVDRAWWLEESERIYDYVSRRLQGAQVEHKVSLGFMRPDERACPVRGLASHNRTPMVLLYVDETSPREYVQAILAHELGHAIPSEGFPGGLPDETALTEGLATYASGKYWAAWLDVPSLDALVRGYVERGEYESIRENYDLHGIYPWQDDAGEDCLARRDKIYSEWGSFLGYLIQTYGWEKAHDLFDSPPPERQGDRQIQFPPDYEGIYGRSLNQLEYEWLAYLMDGQTGRTVQREQLN